MARQDIEQLLNRKHLHDRSGIARLQDTDLDAVAEMALGRMPTRDRSRAMSLLAAARSPSAPRVLAEVLHNPAEANVLRASAATHLGRLGGPEAEDVLLSALPAAAEPILRLKVVSALSQAGSHRSLDVLTRFSGDADEALRKVARLGLAVIVYRDGVGDYTLPVPQPAELLPISPATALAYEVGPVAPAELPALREWMDTRPYGVRPSPESLYQILCAGDRLALTMNAEAMAGGLAGYLRERRLLLALVCDRNDEDGSYSTRWVMFAWPAGEGRFHISAYRADGTAVLFGSGTSDGPVAAFDLSAVRAPGNTALAMSGRVEGQAITFSRTLSGMIREDQRTPTRIWPGSM